MTIERLDRNFSRIYAASCFAFVFGLYLDGWSHQYLFQEIDTFFNPWHAVLYGGYATTCITLVLWTQWRKGVGQRWLEAIAPGHSLSLLGASIFLFAGVGDMLWHEIFGFEKDIEGLVSPSHLVLAAGMALMLTGGMRHWFHIHRRDESNGFWKSLPLLLSMFGFLAQCTFLTQYARYTDFNVTGTAPDDATIILCTQSISLLGILLFSALLSGLFAFVLRRARLPFGSVTLVLTLQVLFLGVMRYGRELVLAALAAGVLGDLLLVYLPPHKRIRSLLIFSFLVPAVFYAGTFLVLQNEGGIWWSLHLWSGVPFIAGIAGLLAGFLGAPNQD